MKTSRCLVAAALGLALVPTATAFAAPSEALFGRTATYPVYLNVPEGVDPNAETVAEISTVTADGNTLIYTDAAGKRIGFLDISDPSSPAGLGTYDLAQAGHADDQPTSVAAYGNYLLVVIDQSGGDFANPSGRVDILDINTREKVASIDLGGQPDSIAISPDGAYAAIAIENQRDEEADDGGLPQSPAGFVQIITLSGDPSGWQATPVNFVDDDGEPVEAIKNVGWDTPSDPEPEYVSINSDNQLAVTVQENNGVAIIDLATGDITNAWSAGTVSMSGIDTKKDGLIDPSGSLMDVAREPDAIGWIDNNHVATANEGDWKGGSRGWTVFDTSGTVVWDAGASFENIATRYGLHNEKRAGKKGPEPEGLAVATYAGVSYAFVASERSNFVAVYDVSDPADPQFTQTLFTTNGPEGVLPIPDRDILAVSSETDDADAGVRSAVNVFQLGAPEPERVTSVDKDGSPIGWTAMSGLSGDPTNPGILYAVSDSALSEGYIYTLDVSDSPVITDRLTVTEAGAPVALDLEGVAARKDGGFWLANEGKTGPENAIIRTDVSGAIVERIQLPAEVADHIGKWGLEGVTVTGSGDSEAVYIALQRPLWTDPSAKPLTTMEGNVARIGRYVPATGAWSWFAYPLEETQSPDWIGLSEITAIDDTTFAIVERDKMNGPRAAIKRVYKVQLEGEGGVSTPVPVTKTLAIDVLPALQATNGWTQEKLEGFTMSSDCSLFAITDNDGLDDATGETLFMRFGSASESFQAGCQTEPVTPQPGNPTTPSSEPAKPTKLPRTGGTAPWLALGLAVAAGVATRRFATR